MVWLTSLLPLAALLFSTAIPNTPPAAWAFSPTTPQKTVQPSSSLAASSPQVKSSSSWPSSLTPPTPIPPPPPISMPVWSFTCPVPFPRTTSSQSFSSMSILTYVTPVSVSQPKLWALSLYKSTLTRSSFLGIPERNQEYNDIASISSSVTSTSGAGGGMVRRVSGMRGMPDAEGSSGWRVHGSGSAVSKGIGKYIGGWNSNLMGVSVDAGTREAGVGILQLMRPSQKTLVPILGKRSGWEEGLDKREECREMGNDWVPVYGSDKSTTFEVLPNCASYIQVKLKRITDGGDHDVAICEVVGTGVWDEKSQTVVWLSESDVDGLDALDSSTALYTGQLRVEGII